MMQLWTKLWGKNRPNAQRQRGTEQKIPKEKSSEELRLDAASRLKDQNELTEIALTAELARLRRSAVRQVTKQNLLAKIARNAKDKHVRSQAVEHLTNL